MEGDKKRMLQIRYAELTQEDVTGQTVDDVNRLLPQLSSASRTVTLASLHAMFDVGTRLFAAFDGDKIIGVTLLCQTMLFGKKKDWIEDVVVDDSHRKRGIGSHLMGMAEKASYESGAESVNLTSNPAREAARRMYEARGYDVRNTAVFCMRHY